MQSQVKQLLKVSRVPKDREVFFLKEYAWKQIPEKHAEMSRSDEEEATSNIYPPIMDIRMRNPKGGVSLETKRQVKMKLAQLEEDAKGDFSCVRATCPVCPESEVLVSSHDVAAHFKGENRKEKMTLTLDIPLLSEPGHVQNKKSLL